MGAVGAHCREGAGQNEHRLPGARHVGLQQHTSSRACPLPPTAFYRGAIGTRTCGACEPLGLLEPDAGKACTFGSEGPGRSNAPGLPGELVGEFKNTGTEWQPTGEPTRVKTHDFLDKQLGRAVPYGVYDLYNDEGWVSLGNRADTAEFAVETIRRWWEMVGRIVYPDAKRLPITADAGGSNGYRVRTWKKEFAHLAEETGLEITVCHYPPGTSKWTGSSTVCSASSR